MEANFYTTLEQIAEEKSLPLDIIIETVQSALAAAYRKDFGDKDQEVRVELDPQSGAARVFVTKNVVEEVENPHLELTLEDAKKIKKTAKVGGTVEYEDKPADFGRVAAQTAKQVIVQRLREAERDIILTEYKDKEDTIINGTVQRVEPNIIFVDLGRTSGVLFSSEQIPGERYYPGQRLKFYVVRVEETSRGPQIVLSRAHPNMVKLLFEMEVPEIAAGSVNIAAIAREAGLRTKVAVVSTAEGVDPVGTFVGGRGARVQAVMGELGEEKIDIILFSEDPKTFIINALSPTKVVDVILDEDSKKATVKVPEDQLSLAIGKQGQNVRLAAKLSGWNIDIVSADESKIEAVAEAAETVAEAPTEKPKAKSKPKGKRVDLEAALIEAVNKPATEPASEAADEPAQEKAADNA